MTIKERLLVKKILKQCQTLDDADAQLACLADEPTTATRWGIWDGWAKRPSSHAGISPDCLADYENGYRLGESLRG